MRTRRLLAGAAAAAALTAAATGCSSSNETTAPTTTTTSTTTTTTARNAGFAVETPDGQVSLSLDGKLPPNWPSGYPVPTGATAAGSGSLGTTGETTMVAVYETAAKPSDTFDFYRSNSQLTVSDASSGGIGNAYLGRLKTTGAYTSSVTVVGRNDKTYIVIVLKGAGGTSGTTPGSTPGTTPGTTKASGGPAA